MSLKELLDAYCDASPIRYHMPGHKGTVPICPAHDVTELDCTDDLYCPGDAIMKLERTLALRSGSKCTLALTDGSSAGVRIIFMVLAEHAANKRVLLADNLHRSAIDGCILAGIDPEILPPCDIEDNIDSSVGAVFLTSPDYYGSITPLESIAKKCKQVNAILAVDEAHGAHLPYIGIKSASSIADISVQSMHKTMGALTQAATLCVNNAELINSAKYHRRGLCTSSPSFLVLESMEWASEQYSLFAEDFLNRLRSLRDGLSLKHASLGSAEGRDPSRLCITVSPYTSGYRASELLKGNGIIPEMADASRVVLILSPHDGDYTPLKQALLSLDEALPDFNCDITVPKAPKCKRVISMRSAALAKKIYLPLRDAIGRICATSAGAYPPGIPCIYPGCIIDEDIALYLTAVASRGEVFGFDDTIAVVDGL